MKYASLLLLLGSLGLSAGDFVNLGFNSPDLSHSTIDLVTGASFAPVGEAIKGWSIAYVDSSVSLPARIPVTDGADAAFVLFPSLGQEESDRYGAYRLIFTSFASTSPPGVLTPRPLTTISQRGTVPVNATSLDYFSSGNLFDEIAVSINGEARAPLVLLGLNKQVDVRAYAGQEVLLEFWVPGKVGLTLDVRGFNSIPEPATWVLFGVGAVLVACAARRKR